MKNGCLQDINGKDLCFYSIRADRKGGMYGHFSSIDDMRKIDPSEISDADKIRNGICPECNFNKLYDGIGTNGESFTACKVCGFFTE